MLNEKLITRLNHPSPKKRLRAMKKLSTHLGYDAGNGEANLQIHSTYSFSPYTPSMGVYMAHKFGQSVVGILDNYTLKGAKEFSRACEYLSLRYVTGVEFCVRCDFLGDEVGSVSLLGIAKKDIKSTHKKIKLLRDNQKENVKKTTDAVSKRMKKYGISLSFKDDVMPYIKGKHDRVYLSKYVYLALAKKMENFEKDEIFKIFNELGVTLSEHDTKIIKSVNDPYFKYDLANIFYNYSDKFYTKKHYHDYQEVISLADETGAICAFSFQKKSPSGKNKDKILSVLPKLKDANINAFCFDDSPFSGEDIQEILDKCYSLQILPLRLNEIEFPRSKFSSNQNQEFNEIFLKSALAVCGSEKCLNSGGNGFLSTQLKFSSFSEKVELYSKIGKGE